MMSAPSGDACLVLRIPSARHSKNYTLQAGRSIKRRSIESTCLLGAPYPGKRRSFLHRQASLDHLAWRYTRGKPSSYLVLGFPRKNPSSRYAFSGLALVKKNAYRALIREDLSFGGIHLLSCAWRKDDWPGS